MTGRPLLLTSGAGEAIILAIRAGNTHRTAAGYAGVSYSTLKRWLGLGRKADAAEPYKGFTEAVAKARADAAIRNVAFVQKAGSKSWQAAAWWLERRYPETYSRDASLIKQLERRVRELEAALARRGASA